MSSYQILGIHGAKVKTVEGDVARVRIFIGDKVYDEDFDLPKLPPFVPPIPEAYAYYLDEAIKKRVEELEKENV